MGLKETLKKQMSEIDQQSRAEDLELIQELNNQLEEAKQLIQTLQSTNSTLQSEKQKMILAVTTAKEQIESLTSRASIVNETEIKNKELLRKATEFKAMRDKALKEAEMAQQQVKTEADRAERALQQARNEEQERYKEQEKTRKIEGQARSSKMTYKNLFVGNSMFTVVLAFLMAYNKRSVFTEVLKWFPDRFNNIKGVFLWFKRIYIGAATLINDHWKLSVVWCYVITSVVFIALLVGLFFLLRLVLEEIAYKIQAIKRQYKDGIFKWVISVDITLSLFFVCLWFYEPIRHVLPLNIFSVWLLLSIIGCAAWNSKEIIGGIKHGY